MQSIRRFENIKAPFLLAKIFSPVMSVHWISGTSKRRPRGDGSVHGNADRKNHFSAEDVASGYRQADGGDHQGLET